MKSEIGSILLDRKTLLVLFGVTGGPAWRNNQGWNTSLPTKEWYGVILNAEDRVVELDLGWNNLRGHIPSQLGDLRMLQRIFLSGNVLTGCIPPVLGTLGSLKCLALNCNQLSGLIPPELGNLTRLEHLILSENELSGAIPVGVGRLAAVQYLCLDNNKLQGSIPDELANLTRLRHLELQGNDLKDQPTTSLQGFPLEAWIKWKFSKSTGAVRVNEAPGTAGTGRNSVDDEESEPSKPLKAAAVEALSSPSEQRATERTVDVLRDAKGAEDRNREIKSKKESAGFGRDLASARKALRPITQFITRRRSRSRSESSSVPTGTALTPPKAARVHPGAISSTDGHDQQDLNTVWSPRSLAVIGTAPTTRRGVQPTPRKSSPSHLGSVTEEQTAESAIISNASKGPAASGGARVRSGSSVIWDVEGSGEDDNTKPKHEPKRSNSSVEMLVSAGSNLPNLETLSMSAIEHLTAVTLSPRAEVKRDRKRCDHDKVGDHAGGTAKGRQRALEADDFAQMSDAADNALGGTENGREGRLTIWDAMKENTEAVSSHAGGYTNRSRRTFFTDAASRFHCSASTLIEADRWSDHLGSFTSNESATNTPSLSFGNGSSASGSSMSYEAVGGHVYEVENVEGSAVPGKGDHGGRWVSPRNRDSAQASGDWVHEADGDLFANAAATDRRGSHEPPGSTANARSEARKNRPAAVVAGSQARASNAQQILEARIAAHEAFMTAQLEIMRKEMEQNFENFRAAAEERTGEEAKTSLVASPDEQGENTTATAAESESRVQGTFTPQNERGTGVVSLQHGNIDGLSRDGQLRSAIPSVVESLAAIVASTNTRDSSKSSLTLDRQGSLWSVFTEGGGSMDMQTVDRPDEQRVRDANPEEKDSDHAWVRRVYEVQVEALVARLKHEEQQNTTLTARLASVEQQLSKTAQEIETERTAREHLLSTMQLEAATAAVETATKMRTIHEAMETMTANIEILAEQIEMTIGGLAAVTGGLEAIPHLASTVEDLALQVAAARGAALHATSTTARHTREQGRGVENNDQGTE